MENAEMVMEPRNQTIADLIESCARGHLPFYEMCAKVAAMGYKTTSLYEMVRAREQEIGYV